MVFKSGGSGIRTHGRFTASGFQDQRIRPLCHTPEQLCLLRGIIRPLRQASLDEHSFARHDRFPGYQPPAPSSRSVETLDGEKRKTPPDTVPTLPNTPLRSVALSISSPTHVPGCPGGRPEAGPGGCCPVIRLPSSGDPPGGGSPSRGVPPSGKDPAAVRPAGPPAM
jgi:hypothetical protein